MSKDKGSPLGLKDIEHHIPEDMEGLGAVNAQGGINVPTKTPDDVKRLEKKDPQAWIDEGDAGSDGSE